MRTRSAPTTSTRTASPSPPTPSGPARRGATPREPSISFSGLVDESHYTWTGASQPLPHPAVGPLAGHRLEGARVSVAAAQATEGDALAFPVSLSHAAAGPVEVPWSLAAGTATADADYIGASGTVTLAPNETARTISVTTVADALDEAAETLVLTLGPPDGALLDAAAASATGTIDDDDDVPAVTLSAGEAFEGDALEVAALLSAPSGRPVEVTWSTADGTAAAGDDYTAVASRTVAFAPGEVRKALSVATVEDAAPEPDETVRVRAERAQYDDEAAAPAAIEATATILDDDRGESRLGPPRGLAAAAPERMLDAAAHDWRYPDRIGVSWQAPAMDGGLTITGYRLEVSADGGRTWRDLASRVPGTSYTHEGLAPGSTRHYRVRALAGGGVEGPPAAAAGATSGHGVRAIRVVSAPASGGVYRAGEAIVVEVTFSTPMTIHSSEFVRNGSRLTSGPPRLDLRIGGSAVFATCEAGTPDPATGMVPCPDRPTSKLRLSYVVQEGDGDTDGIEIQANGLSGGPPWGTTFVQPNGAHIRAGFGISPLTHPAAGPFPGHAVDGGRTTVSVDGPVEVREGEVAQVPVVLSRRHDVPVTVTWSTAEDAAALSSRGRRGGATPALRGPSEKGVGGRLHGGHVGHRDLRPGRDAQGGHGGDPRRRPRRVRRDPPGPAGLR